MFRNAPKVKPSVTGGFRVLATLIGLVVLMSLIAVAFALRKLRDEHMNLRAVVVSGLDSTVQAEESRLAALQARLGALENQLSEQESSELAALVEGLPEAERQKFLTALPVEGPETRHAGLHGRISGTQQPPPVDPAPEPAPESGSQDDFREYIVQPGDTISEIGRFHKVTVAAIIRASGITNPDRILVGEVLKIPPGE